METKNLFDKDFSITAGANFKLLLQLCPNSLVYTIYDIANNKFCGLKQYALEGTRDEKRTKIKEIIAYDALLTSSYAESVLQMQGYKAMLVPDSLFDSKNLKAFLKFHHEVDDKDLIHFSQLKLAEAFIIFSIPAFAEEELKAIQPLIKLSHHTMPVIHNALQNSAIDNSAPTINLHFGHGFFDILVVRNKKIQLFNSFFYKKYTDVIYFISNILNLYSLQPANTQITLSGVIEPENEIKNALAAIFKNIVFEQFNANFYYLPALLNLPQYQFSPLFNSLSCE